MLLEAEVHYHVKRSEPQYFAIDANGVSGALLSPELDSRTVKVLDLRTSINNFSFEKQSVLFTCFPTQVTHFSNELTEREKYEFELESLIKSKLGAKKVLIFDHTLRIGVTDSARKPVRNVHSDYSETGAHNRLRDLLGQDDANKWSSGHFAFINVWRPIEYKVEESPLGFVNPQSVKKDDWELIGLKYPDREGEILGLTYNPSHQWFYLSDMTPDEVVIFNVYDNQGLATVAHSALAITPVEASRPRKSIESRLLVQF